jgi:peptidoglycan biosynthesis protein MviN/MurJ (putative lipid II flippase)
MINVLIAVAFMTTGYTAFALLFFLRRKTWNGYKDKSKLLASFGLIVAISILIVFVPEISSLLKTLGLTMDVENSRMGFVTAGFAISGIVSSKLDAPRANEIAEK